MINIHLGDSYVLVEPMVPPEVEKDLTYWHKTMVYDYSKFKPVIKGQVKKLYTIRQEGQAMVLTTFPGFACRVRQLLVSLGFETQIVDERSIKPKPDYAAAIEGLRDYQLEGIWTLLQSGGGVMACPTGWG